MNAISLSMILSFITGSCLCRNYQIIRNMYPHSILYFAGSFCRIIYQLTFILQKGATFMHYVCTMTQWDNDVNNLFYYRFFLVIFDSMRFPLHFRLTEGIIAFSPDNVFFLNTVFPISTQINNTVTFMAAVPKY